MNKFQLSNTGSGIIQYDNSEIYMHCTDTNIKHDTLWTVKTIDTTNEPPQTLF